MSSSSDSTTDSEYSEDESSESEANEDFETRISNYISCLEESIKEAQKYNLKIPEHYLSSLHETLCGHLSLNGNHLQVRAAFEAAKQVNESSVGSKTLTFSTSKPANCVSSRGRFSYFDEGNYLKSIRSPTINNDCIPGKKIIH